MDYTERLTACGMTTDDAWMLADDFLSDGDKEGLIAYIEDLERSQYCTVEVVEEVLRHVGLEKIQP